MRRSDADGLAVLVEWADAPVARRQSAVSVALGNASDEVYPDPFDEASEWLDQQTANGKQITYGHYADKIVDLVNLRFYHESCAPVVEHMLSLAARGHPDSARVVPQVLEFVNIRAKNYLDPRR